MRLSGKASTDSVVTIQDGDGFRRPLLGLAGYVGPSGVMDNASRAWELPGPMRWVRVALMGALLVLVLVRTATGATSARSAPEQASAAFPTEPAFGRMPPADAIDELRQVADDPQAEPLMRRLAERERVDALVATGRIDQAADEARQHEDRLDPHFVTQVERLLVRRAVRRTACAVLVAFAALVGIGLWRAGRRRALDRASREVRKLAPVAVGFVLFVAVAGGALASKYESGSALPFVLLGAGLLPLLFLGRAWSAVGSQTAVARAARGLLCGMTVVAEAFLLLDLYGSQYLPGFGL